MLYLRCCSSPRSFSAHSTKPLESAHCCQIRLILAPVGSEWCLCIGFSLKDHIFKLIVTIKNKFVNAHCPLYFKKKKKNRENKNQLNFHFHTSFWYQGLHKTFWGNKKKCENKNLSWFIQLIRVGTDTKSKLIFVIEIRKC